MRLPTPLLLSFVVALTACNDDIDLVDEPAPQPSSSNTRPPSSGPSPSNPGPDPGGEPTPPPRKVDGTLLVSGKVKVVGVTDDGWIAYFLMPPGGTTKTFEVMDPKTKKRVSLGTAGSANDTAIVRGKAVALWTNLRAPYGWGGLTVWTASSGVTSAKSAMSLPGLFATNEDASRLAFTTGLPPNQAGITQLATSAPAAIAAPQIFAPNVGIGDKTTACIPVVGFHGARLFTSSCEGSATTGTIRMIDAAGTVTTVQTGARPAWSADPTGSRILVTTGAGVAELHSLPSNDVVPVASNVSSATLTPDGATVLHTTAGTALVRSPVANPATATTLLATGAREILNVSPDGKHAVVASLPADPSSSSTHRTDLHLVSLDAASAPVTPVPLLTTATGMSWGFTKSGSHALYITDLTGIGFDGMKVRARPVNGGPEIVLGTEVRAVVHSASSKIVFVEQDQTTYRYDVKVIDLEKGVAPSLLIDDVESATAQGDTAYVGVGAQGLYAIALP